MHHLGENGAKSRALLERLGASRRFLRCTAAKPRLTNSFPGEGEAPKKLVTAFKRDSEYAPKRPLPAKPKS